MTHVNVSTHAQPLASGQVIPPGGLCEPDPKSEHDQALITDGALIPADTGKKARKED